MLVPERDNVPAQLRRETRITVICLALGAGLMAMPAPALQSRAFAFYAAFLQTGITIVCGSIVALLIGHSGKRGLGFLRSQCSPSSD